MQVNSLRYGVPVYTVRLPLFPSSYWPGIATSFIYNYSFGQAQLLKNFLRINGKSSLPLQEDKPQRSVAISVLRLATTTLMSSAKWTMTVRAHCESHFCREKKRSLLMTHMVRCWWCSVHVNSVIRPSGKSANIFFSRRLFQRPNKLQAAVRD